MRTTGFHTFIKNARPPDGPFKDFVEDARRDEKLPNHFCDADALRFYLILRGACSEAIEIADVAIRHYEGSIYHPLRLRKKGKP